MSFDSVSRGGAGHIPRKPSSFKATTSRKFQGRSYVKIGDRGRTAPHVFTASNKASCLFRKKLGKPNNLMRKGHRRTLKGRGDVRNIRQLRQNSSSWNKAANFPTPNTSIPTRKKPFPVKEKATQLKQNMPFFRQLEKIENVMDQNENLRKNKNFIFSLHCNNADKAIWNAVFRDLDISEEQSDQLSRLFSELKKEETALLNGSDLNNLDEITGQCKQSANELGGQGKDIVNECLSYMSIHNQDIDKFSTALKKEFQIDDNKMPLLYHTTRLIQMLQEKQETQSVSQSNSDKQKGSEIDSDALQNKHTVDQAKVDDFLNKIKEELITCSQLNGRTGASSYLTSSIAKDWENVDYQAALTQLKQQYRRHNLDDLANILYREREKELKKQPSDLDKYIEETIHIKDPQRKSELKTVLQSANNAKELINNAWQQHEIVINPESAEELWNNKGKLLETNELHIDPIPKNQVNEKLKEIGIENMNNENLLDFFKSKAFQDADGMQTVLQATGVQVNPETSKEIFALLHKQIEGASELLQKNVEQSQSEIDSAPKQAPSSLSPIDNDSLQANTDKQHIISELEKACADDFICKQYKEASPSSSSDQNIQLVKAAFRDLINQINAADDVKTLFTSISESNSSEDKDTIQRRFLSIFTPPSVIPVSPPLAGQRNDILNSSDIKPLSNVAEENKHNQGIRQAVQQLEDESYNYYRQIRGDGNCFYRACSFGIVEQAIRDNKLSLFIEMIENSDLRDEKEQGQITGHRDLRQSLIEGLRTLQTKTRDEQLKQFENDMKTNQNNFDTALIMEMRALIANDIEKNKLALAPSSICLGDELNATTSWGHDAESLAIQRAPMALKTKLYGQALNRNDPTNPNLIPPPEKYINDGFATENDFTFTTPVTLFFKPGHYDLLYKNDLLTEEEKSAATKQYAQMPLEQLERHKSLLLEKLIEKFPEKEGGIRQSFHGADVSSPTSKKEFNEGMKMQLQFGIGIEENELNEFFQQDF